MPHFHHCCITSPFINEQYAHRRRACVFLTGKRSIVIFIDWWSSSVTHAIAKNRQLLHIVYRRLGNKNCYMYHVLSPTEKPIC